jgi:hypothetical protein
LLEITFSELASTHLKTQRYWTLAVQAALTAQQVEDRIGPRLKRIPKMLNIKISSRKRLGITAIEQQIRANGMHQSSQSTTHTHKAHHNQTTLISSIKKHPHLSTALNALKSNKHLCKPD